MFFSLAEAAAAQPPQFDMEKVYYATLIVFFLRLCDMTIDTLRVMSMVRGLKWRTAGLGFMQAMIFIATLAQVLTPPIHLIQMLGYALGFSAGTLIGMTIGGRISSTFLLFHVISRKSAQEICDALRAAGFAVTTVSGEGREGPLMVLYAVMKRSQGGEALKLVRSMDQDAFVVSQPIERAMGGYIPQIVNPGGSGQQ